MEKTNLSHETEYPLYVLYSGWTTRDIEELLESLGTKRDYSNMRIDYRKDGTELVDTNRAFICMSDSLVQRLKDEKYDRPNKRGFSFAKFKISDDFKLDSKSLCFPVPSNSQFTGSELKKCLLSKMQTLENYGIVKHDDYTVVVPLFNREADVPKNACYVNFASSVPTDAIICIRTILNYSYWDGLSDEKCMCFFSRSLPQKEKKPVKKEFYKKQN